jgi:hypothetical protein
MYVHAHSPPAQAQAAAVAEAGVPAQAAAVAEDVVPAHDPAVAAAVEPLSAADMYQQNPHAPLHSSVYRSNSPRKGRSQKPENVWDSVKRYNSATLVFDKDSTHVCVHETAPGVFCNKELKSWRRPRISDGKGGGWISTVAINHMKTHPESKPAMKAEAGAQQRQGDLVQQSLSYSQTPASGTFVLSNNERALTSQAHWYVYSDMHISKREFESERFASMIHGGKATGVPILSQYMLKKYVAAEFELFQIFLRFMLNKVRVGVHDQVKSIKPKNILVCAVQGAQCCALHCANVLCTTL